MTFDISKNILTVPEVAFILNCSSQKVYELIHLKKIYAYKDAKTNGKNGRAWKITAFSVYCYVDDSLNKYKKNVTE